MTTFRRLSPLVFLVAVIVPAASSSAQPLEWKLSEGDLFKVSVEQTSKLVSEVDTVEQIIESDFAVEIDWRIESVNGKRIATVEQTIKRWSMSINTPTPDGSRNLKVDTSSTEPVVGDSKKALENLMKFIDEPFEIEMSPAGAIMKVKIPESLKKKIRDAPQSMQVRKLLDEQQIKQMFGTAAFVFPDEPAKEGLSWNAVREFDTELGKFSQRHDFTNAGTVNVDGVPMEKITIEANLELLEVAKGSDTKIVGQIGTGTALFDKDAGYLRSVQFKHELKTSKPYREMKLNASMTSELNLNIRKIK